MDTMNHWGVGVGGKNRVTILMPPGSVMAPYRAKLLAAYLITMAEAVEATTTDVGVIDQAVPFEQIMTAVRSS